MKHLNLQIYLILVPAIGNLLMVEKSAKPEHNSRQAG